MRHTRCAVQHDVADVMMLTVLTGEVLLPPWTCTVGEDEAPTSELPSAPVTNVSASLAAFC